MLEKSTRGARGVQMEDVAGAADAVLGRGERPTIERVRAELGRGSPNTVGPMLDVWYSTLSTRLLTDTGGNVDAETLGSAANGPSLPSAVVRAASVLWGRALQQAQDVAIKAVESDYQEIHEQRDQIAAERVVLEDRRIRLEEKADAMVQTLAVKDEQIHDLARQVQVLHSAHSMKEQEIAGLRASNAALLAAADVERERARTELEAHRQERQQLEQRAAAQERRLLEELDRARQDAKRVAHQATLDAAKSDKSLALLQAKLESAGSEYGALVAANQALSREIDAARDELVNSHNVIAQLRQDAANVWSDIRAQLSSAGRVATVHADEPLRSAISPVRKKLKKPLRPRKSL